jgi:hypothetical protein
MELELLPTGGRMSRPIDQLKFAAKNMETVETVESLKLEIRKLSSRAIQTKMDLHDLSEELPTRWERIQEVAEKTFVTYQKLAETRKKLAELEG